MRPSSLSWDGVALFARCSIGFMFVISAAAKAANFSLFRSSVGGLGVPRELRRSVALGVVASEGVLGVMSTLGFLRRVIDYSIVALVVALLLVVAVGTAKRVASGCGCFGALTQSRFGPLAVLRSVVIALVAIAVAFTRGPLDSWVRLSPLWAVVVLATLCALAGTAAQASVVVASVREEGRRSG